MTSNSNVCLLVLESLRPLQWMKNLFILAAIVFSRKMTEPQLALTVGYAFLVFCAMSGAIYVLNDIADLKEDRLHPVKSRRPLASGRLKVWQAWTAFLVLAPASLGAAYVLDASFFFVALGYFALQLAYSWGLKRVVILDAFAVACGFVLRVVAGACVIHVAISSWLLLCTTFLALFLTLGKRRHELAALGKDAELHRKSLGGYSPYLLDQMIAVVTASTLVAYALYTMDHETITKFGTRRLVLTVPFVLFGMFRYLYLVHENREGGSPEHTLVTDKTMMVTVLLWALTVGMILYGKDLWPMLK